MNWKVILTLVLFGLLIFLGSTFGIIKAGTEAYYWIVLGAVSAVIISKTCERIFVSSVLTGLFTGILGSILQSVMFNTYLQNNPQSLDGFKELPIEMEPQYVILFSGPFFGIFYGLLMGIVAAIFKRILRK